MSQVAFLIVFLLAFGERKSVSTLRANDLYVWHVAVSMSRTEVSPLSLLFGAQANLRSVSIGCYPQEDWQERGSSSLRLTVLAFRNGLSGASLLHRYLGFKGYLSPQVFTCSSTRPHEREQSRPASQDCSPPPDTK